MSDCVRQQSRTGLGNPGVAMQPRPSAETPTAVVTSNAEPHTKSGPMLLPIYLWMRVTTMTVLATSILCKSSEDCSHAGCRQHGFSLWPQQPVPGVCAQAKPSLGGTWRRPSWEGCGASLEVDFTWYEPFPSPPGEARSSHRKADDARRCPTHSSRLHSLH